MFKNYYKVAIRNLIRNKLYTSICIFGLSISLAVTLIVVGHVNYELSFENFHKNKDQIFRVNGKYTSGDEYSYSAMVMTPLGQEINSQIPEVENTAIFRMLGELNLKIGEESFKNVEDIDWAGFKHNGNTIAANSDFLKVFSFPIIVGNPDNVLDEPFSIIISKRIVDEYFFGENPVGQEIRINDELNCKVKGIMKNVPENTQIHCDFIVSYSTLKKSNEINNDWQNLEGDYVYLLLKKDANPKLIEQKIYNIFKDHVPIEEEKKYEFELQKLKDIYFDVYGSGRRGDLSPAGEISMIIEIGMIALFILLLAIFNFINLSTARYTDRLKEIGVRKVFGAYINNLIKRFLTETMFLTFISMLLSLMFYEIFLRLIRANLPREMFANFTHTPLMVISIIGMILVVGFLAGFYPAVYLSKFKPFTIFQKRFEGKSSKSILRKILVVFQFTIAVGFICCTVIIFKQFSLITNMNLGFEKENMMIIDFDKEKGADACLLFKNEMQNNSFVIDASTQNSPPGRQSYNFYGFYPNAELKDEDMFVTKTYFVDENFLPTFGLKLKEGREFSSDISGDVNHSVIINESAIKELGISNLIGYKFYNRSGKIYEVIGVVENFHGTTLDWGYESISVIIIRPEKCTTLTLKLNPKNLNESISKIKETWEQIFPDKNFIYSFLDEEIANNYNEMKVQWQIFGIISLFTIILACLGIFGLVSYTSQQRTKEIGIRKVFGASVPKIMIMFSKEFVILISISNLIAWLLAYIGMSKFLNEFPFKTNIGFSTFLITGSFVFFIAILTTGFRSYRAASGNPVDALKYE